MSTFFIGRSGEIYHGDMRPGDRRATDQELQEQAARARPVLAAAQIRALEFEQLMPRAVREFMLLTLEAQATPEQLALLPAYVKLKAFDNQIAVLRAIVRGDA